MEMLLAIIIVVGISFLLSLLLNKLFNKKMAWIPSGLLLLVTLLMIILIVIPEDNGSWSKLGYLIIAILFGISFIINALLTLFLVKNKN